MPRVRLNDADRERLGTLCRTHRGNGCPEWVEVDLADILNEETGLLETIEETFGLMAEEYLSRAERGSLKAARATAWLARNKAGCRDDPRTFRPNVLPTSGVRYEPTEAERARTEEALAADASPPTQAPPANRAARRSAGQRGGASPS